MAIFQPFFMIRVEGELHQMDVTNVYIKGISVLYLIVIIDDHSRFVPAADLCHDQRGDTLIGVLHKRRSCARKEAQTNQGLEGVYSLKRLSTA